MDVDIESSPNNHNAKTPRALSKGQERKVIDFLEYSFQDVESSFTKRSEPSLSKLPTLTASLDAMHHLLAFILQIPSIDAFLLCLTSDVTNSVPGYPPNLDGLPQLLDFLDDLDEAWSAVLNSQVWDPSLGTGVNLVIPVDMMELDRPIRSTPVSQTERTRLHSLLVTGTAGLEEWLPTLSSLDSR
ncbi:hypothetical protein JVT61DRAFT_2640 [Boletus reticuloceps]|uniref:Uncharacterized protein n=1 Tax=Boletus reticuloceps TaxID=495285 RepID=A0A8I2YMY1_9AGAM|nr:hypothetical protein JVT61DRAFT_2640 [Boletus reticuloceps]